MNSRLLILALVLFFSAQVSARDWQQLPMVQLVQYADLIVHGKVFKEEHTMYIRVDSVLVGKKLEIVRVLYREWFGVYENEEGIFFLRKDHQEDAYYEFHPNDSVPLEELEKVERVIAMWAFPEKYSIHTEEESPDINYILSQLFMGWRVHSPEAARFEYFTKTICRDTYKEALWEEKDKITLTVKCDENSVCTIASDQPASALSKLFARKVKSTFSLFQARKESLAFREFSVTIDNTKTDINLAGLTYDVVADYLSDRLASANSVVVTSAIQALTVMGDTACLAKIAPLINSPDPEIAGAALKTLGWSRNSAAADAIGLLLAEKSVLYPVQHGVIHAAVGALRKINHPGSVLYLEAAAKYGVPGAISMLSVMGRKESVDVLITVIKTNPEKCYRAVNTLYWLVKRSNYPIEQWMTDGNGEHGDEIKKRVPLWLKWSEQLGSDFEIIHTLKEVRRLFRNVCLVKLRDLCYESRRNKKGRL